jgi:hypothetical protein
LASRPEIKIPPAIIIILKETMQGIIPPVVQAIFLMVIGAVI